MKQYVFAPKEDITVKELAQVVAGLMIIVPEEIINNLSKEDEGLKKHFVEVPEKPRIMVPHGQV